MLCEVSNPVSAHLRKLKVQGKKALCPFMIAGDPTPQVSFDLVDVAVGAGADVLEFCIPFERSITDGPTIKAGYHRALSSGVDTEKALQLMEQAAQKLPVVCLADYRDTVRPYGLEEFLARAKGRGAGAILIHGLPPLLRPELITLVARLEMGLVNTVYPETPAPRLKDASETASAFLYLVSSYGRSGGAFEPCKVAALLNKARGARSGPIAIGFGLKSAADHAAAFRIGADMTIVGSALTKLTEDNLGHPDAILKAWDRALADLAKAKTQIFEEEGCR